MVVSKRAKENQDFGLCAEKTRLAGQEFSFGTSTDDKKYTVTFSCVRAY